MSVNPPDLRPDLARARLTEDRRAGQPTIGMVSLGCPKALVDSERILTRLRAEGYGISPDYAGADAVIVNTCGFLDSAKAESLDAKISEGCNHACKFCIIPDMRGKLVSRPHGAVMREAERLVGAGVKELLVISQDTSAYGTDWQGREAKAPIVPLARDLAALGAWVRLHYVYPYPHVRDLVPLMAGGGVLPYLDIPFQHAHPDVLRRMARPAASAKTLDEIAAWRDACPDIALRSTFIVGYPGETEAEFDYLLDWLREARLDRVGCFRYENVAGARSNALPDHVPEEVKEERWQRFMETAQAISAERLAEKVGRTIDAIVDEVDEEAATCRTMADAPEIDGNLFIDENFEDLAPGDIVTVLVEEAGDYDLWGRLV